MIVVDTREPEEYQKIGDRIQTLKYGDFDIMTHTGLSPQGVTEDNPAYWAHHYVLERKTPQDFWQSLKSGRLNNQLAGSQALILDCHEHGTHMEEYFDPNFTSEEFTIERFWDSVNGVSTHHDIFIILNIPHLQRMLRRYEEKKVKGIFGRLTK